MNAHTIKVELFETTPVPAVLAKMALPTIMSQLITLIYNMADTWFIGRTNNPYMVAASSLVLTIYLITMAAANLAASQADAMRMAASNTAGAAVGFMGMGMANAMGGGMNMQGLYGMGAGGGATPAAGGGAPTAASAPTAAPDTWTCSCGAQNTGRFCSNCGSPRP